MNKQLFEKQSNQYNPFFPIVRLDDIIETISDKSIQWILNNYNHIYVEYSESVAITRNKVPSLLRRNGLWISYNTGKDIITEWYKGKNVNINDYNQWTDDANWAKFEHLADGKITYQHLSHALKQLIGKGNNITNFPDEEDITTDGVVLSFKDREYDTNNFSGLGKIILRKNIVLIDGVYKNVLTQDMISKSNTIYEIRYDFDLNGEEITIPEGCVLDFQGGSLSNGNIILNKTKLGNSNLKIFKDILLQGTSGSDIYLSMYEWDATYSENNYNILYNIYSVIRNTDFQVVWDIKDIFLIQSKDSIYLDNNKVHDFNNTTIHIHSKINACLFNIEGNYIQTSYTTISNAIQDNFFKNKYGVILVKDLTPLYKRPGYSDTYYREDVLLVENNRLLSSPILEYDNDAETKAEIYFIDADSKVAFKNLVFDRRGSQNIVSLLQILKCYNPIISNITVDSDNENNLTGEMGIISIKESYNPYLEDITISNTHGGAVGSGLYSYSILLL